MIRTLISLGAIALLSACASDGRGTQYSSARASVPAATYIPVTPGATPVLTVPAGAIPVTVQPAGTPIGPPTVSSVSTPIEVAAAPVSVPVLAPVAAPVSAPTPAPETVTQAAVALPRTPAAPEPRARFATGPIYSACQKAGRKAASRARCGCVQWVADRELSASDQRRGAGYFSNQHKLQQVRQTSEQNAANGKFWAAWKAYGQSASRQCSGT